MYRTDSRGWGVRCWDAIKPGTFVAPFTGEVCHCDTIDARNAAAGAAEEGTEALYSAQEYQFDLEVKAVDQYLGIVLLQPLDELVVVVGKTLYLIIRASAMPA